MTQLFFSFGLLFFSHFAAARGSDCEARRAMVDATQITTAVYESEDICWISVHPANSYKDLKYRDYMLGNDGLFFVFNSYGEGNNSSTTGAREYYIFPRLQYPYFDENYQNNTVTVTLANGERIEFDGKTSRVNSISGATFFESPHLSPKNQGGFELKLNKGILLDCGFAMGNSPSANSNQTCKFIDAQNNICPTKARELFKYSSDGDSSFKFTNDLALKNFLKQRCSNLNTLDL